MSDTKPSNRLANEKSPYLLQHAHNPVDWYPWGEEAFAKAKEENKLIFLSVGYSTCHWCHVMERESFENEATAKLMNENFVNIKVDREERPDVDALYMRFVQATTGQGGWPMSVWLTPELKPVVGGTYFPPVDAHGRAGFPRVLTQIAKLWQSEPEKMIAQSEQVTDALSQHFASGGNAPGEIKKEEVLDRAYESFAQNFDAERGGCGAAPKFPRPTVLFFRHREYDRRGAHTEEGREAMEMSLATLNAMAAGGMHDHLGGGFHRYSVDEYWHIPHYEKMLYDQAQLALAYLEAYQITGEAKYADVTRDILDYVLRDMTSPEGGFYSAEDADSLATPDADHKKEGAFYVWTKSELDAALGDDAKLFNAAYGVEEHGNARPESDPHGELSGTNTLYRRWSDEQLAEVFKLTPEQVKEKLVAARQKLFDLRHQRPHPHLDDKVLTAWNGLMIAAFARAGAVLNEPTYLAAAERAIGFIRDKMMADGELLRSYREGPSDIPGFADDYATFIWGLLEVYQVIGKVAYLKLAETLQTKQIELFYDKIGGGFFTHSGRDKSVLMRFKEDYDAAEPSATAVSAQNLLRLAAMLDRDDWQRLGEASIESLQQAMEQAPTALPHLLGAVQFSLQPVRQVILAGNLEDGALPAFRAEALRRFSPQQVLLQTDAEHNQPYLAEHSDYLKSLQVPESGVVAHVCENFVCQLPVSELEKFRLQLEDKD